jgi:hypothetical protein
MKNGFNGIETFVKCFVKSLKWLFISRCSEGNFIIKPVSIVEEAT